MFNEHEPNRPSDEAQLPAELAALERELSRLTPAPLRLDRDRLMFTAGRASTNQDGRAMHIAGPSRSGSLSRHIAGPSWSGSWSGSLPLRFWPAATAVMTAASVMLAMMLFWQTPPEHNDLHIAKQAAPQQSQFSMMDVRPVAVADTFLPPSWFILPWSELPTSGYLATRHAALSLGLAALDREVFAAGTNGTPAHLNERPPTARELLREFIPEPISPLDARS